MNARTTRILKEVREMFLPWCAVTIVGDWLLSHWPTPFGLRNAVLPISFYIAIPFVASLPLGNEFRQGTFSLLLSQPVDRMKIWREKTGAAVIAALLAALYFGFWGSLSSFPASLIWRSEYYAFSAVHIGQWFIITVCSATFWTLVSRSIMGGVILNLLHALFIVNGGLGLISSRQNLQSPTKALVALSVETAGIVCYSAVMLWLGRRELAKFQSKGGMTKGDLLMTRWNVVPKALTRWFRCRPTGASLNLIRKELWLLRPLWLITLLLILCGIALRITEWFIPLRLHFDDSTGSFFRFTESMMTSLFLLAAVLAGSLSLGQERDSGRLSWHMAQPVLASRQWVIKLAVAIFGSIVCVFSILVLRLDAPLYIYILILSLTGFWCASAISGTWLSSLWVLPVLGVLILASLFGEAAGKWAATGTLIDSLISQFHPLPFTDAMLRTAVDFRVVAVWLVVPTVLLALVQSYRMFRTERPSSSVQFWTRCVLPLAVVPFLCGFSLRVYGDFVGRPMFQALRETHQALGELQAEIATANWATRKFSGEEVAKAYPLTELTRRWLEHSIVTVAPNRTSRSEFYSKGHLNKDVSKYYTTINLPNNWVCTAYGAGYWYCAAPDGSHLGNIDP